MAKNKKNRKNQTFDVYPYLGQYQYLMRTGGQLPWYQTDGPVEDGDASGKPVKPDQTDEAYDGNSQAYVKALNQYYKDLEVWYDENDVPEDQREKDNVKRKEVVEEEDNTEDNTDQSEDANNEEDTKDIRCM